jgi:hypothetical protein
MSLTTEQTGIPQDSPAHELWDLKRALGIYKLRPDTMNAQAMALIAQNLVDALAQLEAQAAPPEPQRLSMSMFATMDDYRAAQGSQADQQAFENWSKREGAVNLHRAIGMNCEDGRFPATYHYSATETAWRAWANKPVAAPVASPPDSTGGAEPEPGSALHGDPTWRTADISWVCEHLKANSMFDGALLLREWNAMKAIALAAESVAQPVQAVPAGWRLVPIEPTEEMISAGDVYMDGVSQLGDAWANMLASAPEFAPPEPPQ